MQEYPAKLSKTVMRERGVVEIEKGQGGARTQGMKQSGGQALHRSRKNRSFSGENTHSLIGRMQLCNNLSDEFGKIGIATPFFMLGIVTARQDVQRNLAVVSLGKRTQLLVCLFFDFVFACAMGEERIVIGEQQQIAAIAVAGADHSLQSGNCRAEIIRLPDAHNQSGMSFSRFQKGEGSRGEYANQQRCHRQIAPQDQRREGEEGPNENREWGVESKPQGDSQRRQ